MPAKLVLFATNMAFSTTNLIFGIFVQTFYLITHDILETERVHLRVEHDDASILPAGRDHSAFFEAQQAEHGTLVHTAYQLLDRVGASPPHYDVSVRVAGEDVAWGTPIIASAYDSNGKGLPQQIVNYVCEKAQLIHSSC